MNTRQVLFGSVAAAPFVMVALIMAALSLFGVDATMTVIDPAVPVLFVIAPVLLIGWMAFIVDVWKNPIMPPDKRWLWTALMVFGKWSALPFYWWFYIRDPNTSSSSVRPA